MRDALDMSLPLSLDADAPLLREYWEPGEKAEGDCACLTGLMIFRL